MIDIEKAIVALATESADFVLIGGVALSIHSAAYVTYDIDFCFSREKANLVKITRALSPFSPRPRNFPKELPFIWDVSTLGNGSVFKLDTSIGDIDLLSEVAGLGSYENVLSQSEKFEMFGVEIDVLSVAGLIAAKIAAGREKDLLGLTHLKAIQAAHSDSEL